MGAAAETILHASCVAVAGRGVLILGASGAGKSGLALQLMALGAQLVADDRTIVTAEGETLSARAPAPIRGLIEARRVGLLRAPALDRAPVVLAVDMEQAETDRLPPERTARILDRSVPLLRRVDRPYFPAAILLMAAAGRYA